MRAGGVCDVNSPAGLILSVCFSDEALTDLKDSQDSQVAFARVPGYRCTEK